MFYWLEMITEILSFLQIFNVRKTTIQFFNISKNLQENRQKKYMAYFGPLKANYRLFSLLVSGKLPPRELPPMKISPYEYSPFESSPCKN